MDHVLKAPCGGVENQGIGESYGKSGPEYSQREHLALPINKGVPREEAPEGRTF